jgi:hypothetical protein
MGNMGIRSSADAAACAVLLSAVAMPCAARDNCVFEITTPEEPYYVHGTLVVPQSNYLVVDECEKTKEEVRHGILPPEIEREAPSPRDLELQRQARIEGEALIRRRDEAARKRQESEESLQGFLGWLWGRTD